MGRMSPHIQSIDNIDKMLNGARAVIESLAGKNTWPDAILLEHALDQSTLSLGEHLKTLSQKGGILLQSDGNAEQMASDMEVLLKEWHIDKNPPSLLAMCVFLLDFLDLKPDPDDANMVIISAILGQVQNDVPYHSDMHFRKVLSQTMRVIVSHNGTYKDMERALSVKEICRLISAACIHDLGHDGQGNWVKGVHHEGRAEKMSFELAKPFLRSAGCDVETLNALYVMLLTTDVSPLDDPGNPMMQMKAAYRYHYMGESKKAHTLNLSTDIRILEKDDRLSQLCLFLHEADIATSAGITYDVTKFETVLLMEEFGRERAHPSQVVDFLNQICQRRFLSEAGQKLYAAPLARIYAQAEEDMRNGDEEYPSSPNATFNIPFENLGGNKTIN